MGIIDEIKDRARQNRKTIALPETMDKRIYEAAQRIVEEDFADVVLIGTPEDIEKYGAGYDLSKVRIVNPFTDPNR